MDPILGRLGGRISVRFFIGDVDAGDHRILTVAIGQKGLIEFEAEVRRGEAVYFQLPIADLEAIVHLAKMINPCTPTEG